MYAYMCTHLLMLRRRSLCSRRCLLCSWQLCATASRSRRSGLTSCFRKLMLLLLQLLLLLLLLLLGNKVSLMTLALAFHHDDALANLTHNTLDIFIIRVAGLQL